MRKAQLRSAVAVELAMRGYAPGGYAWVRSGRRVVLRVLTKPDAKLSKSSGDLSASCYVELHLRAGKTSRRAVFEAIEQELPVIGPAKQVARECRPSTAMQMELV